jgi:rSAM-partnered protein
VSEESVRSRVREVPRDATDDEWEVFVRGRAAGPVRHVGSVTAATPERARDLAATLFGGDAAGIWLTAATDVHRYEARALGARAGDDGPVPGEDGDESQDGEKGDDRSRRAAGGDR